YRFRSFFAAMKFADDLPLELADEQAKINQHNNEIDAKIQPLQDELDKLPKDDKPAHKELKKKIEALEKERRSFTRGLLVTDKPDGIATLHVLFQGNHQAPREAVEPGLPSIFDPQAASISKPPSGNTTGRRLMLANWI